MLEKKKNEKVLKNPGIFLIDMKLELNIFLEEINDHKAFGSLPIH